jgi:uncharacterized protein (TIGR00730 family)
MNPQKPTATPAAKLDAAEAHAERLRQIRSSGSYRIAHTDAEFMGRVELRPVRLQLELLKPELIMQEQNVHSTIVVFGGTRILEQQQCEQKLARAERELAKNPEDPILQRDVRIAKNVLKKAPYYDEARKLGQIVTSVCQSDDQIDYVIVTGGGPGIMEAANRGAHDVDGKSIGLNITLPFEQEPNSYISPELCFEFTYFAVRKMHFLMRAKAMVAFPGGYGTLDELFETLTLIQTRRMAPIPVVLFGRDYWSKLINWDLLVDEGTISPEDIELISYAETAEDCWRQINNFYIRQPGEKLPRGQ